MPYMSGSNTTPTEESSQEQQVSYRKYIIVALFILSVITAFSMRTHVYNKEMARIKSVTGSEFVPFTVESAIMYSYAHDVATGKGIPEFDEKLVGMEDYKVSEQMTLGLEYFLGYSYRLKNLLFGRNSYDETTAYEDDPDFTLFAHSTIRFWTSLTTGFIFLWLIIFRCPIALAFFGALIHAFSPAAIARYTGQDLVRGEFCLPLVTASLLLAYWSYQKSSKLRSILLGVTIFLAIASWDMCQIIFGIWSVYELLRLVCGGVVNDKRRNSWLVIYVALVLAAIFIPYHQEHKLLLSPLVFITGPALIITYCFGSGFYKKRIVILLGSVIALIGVWFLVSYTMGSSGNYSHFAELLKAKLKFNNVKPTDPSLLNFDARILWVPAMHSANWLIFKTFFPGAVYFFFLSFFIFLPFRKGRKSFRYNLPRLSFPIFMSLVYMVGFYYIVRYHVFAILFISLALPLMFSCFYHTFKNKIMITVLVILIALTVNSEFMVSYKSVRSYLNIASLKPQVDVIKWFREAGMKDKTILTDFLFSPMLKAYCGSKILLQPKFEIGKTRKKVETFIKQIYFGTEETLNKFCMDNKVDYFIYDQAYSPKTPLHIYSIRYIAGAKHISPKSPSFRMFKAPDKCRWFYRIAPPKELSALEKRYLIYKVIKPKDVIESIKYIGLAERWYRKGSKIKSKLCALKAFRLDPNSRDARVLYIQLFGKTPEMFLNYKKKI